MRRIFSTLAVMSLGTALLTPLTPLAAQQAPAPKAAAKAAPAQSSPKAGPGEKVCRHKFPDGTPKAWVCKTAEPCCAWDEIKYVKCGSTVFACL
jgi:hypothetical protein